MPQHPTVINLKLYPAVLAALLVALAATAAARPSLARPQRDLARVDLSVRPGDVKPAPAAARHLARLLAVVPGEGPQTYALSDQVEATDRVRRGEIPDRRRLQNGLGIGGDGSLLRELLEDQTIPLFRVTLEPPF